MNQREYTGNYFNHKERGLVTFEDFTWHEIYENMDKLENFEPIPITEEWLDRFEFEWFENKGTASEGLHNYVRKGIYYSFDADGICEQGYYGHRLKYVHQLQNLYFARTGEELTIADESPYEQPADKYIREAKKLCERAKQK